MEVIRTQNRPQIIAPSATVIGTFDGVHLGHHAVISAAVDAAHSHGRPAVVITFDRHPRAYLDANPRPEILTTLETKLELLDNLGLDYAIVLDFSEIHKLDPADFALTVISRQAWAQEVYVGENFRFGNNAKGTPELLGAFGMHLGFAVTEVPLLMIDGAPVSSTRIRDLWSAGRVEEIPPLLGRHHFVTGKVVHGSHRGAALGFPTANLEIDKDLRLPARGVYAGRLRVGSCWHAAAINVGKNPTFGAGDIHCEAHILDFDKDIYGEQVALELRHKLRDERKFASPEALAEQIEADVEAARQSLSQPTA